MNNFKLFGIIGNPVLHSLSPNIYNALFERDSINAKYIRIAISDEKEAIDTINEMKLNGVNITMPFKQSIMSHLKRLDPLTKSINALNTIIRNKETLSGYNTDYYGVIHSLRDFNVNVKGKKCVVLGSGGAGRTSAYTLVKHNADVTIVNRTYEKARKVAEELNCKSEDINKLKTLLQGADMLISTIPTDADVINEEWLRPELIVFDAIYYESNLQSKAQNSGCKLIISGKDWLINQAIPVYKLFTGITADKGFIRQLISETKISTSQNISLIGFIGTGKTTIGKVLAEKLGYDFIDLDSLIEKNTGKSVSEIFAKNGEETFRNYEKNILREIIKSKNIVLSCGGGIILDEKNRELLKKHFLNIWLFSPVKDCVGRIDLTTRPLLSGVNDVLGKAEALYNERIDKYADVSQIVFRNKSTSIKEIAQRVYNTNNR